MGLSELDCLAVGFVAQCVERGPAGTPFFDPCPTASLRLTAAAGKFRNKAFDEPTI
jgi:hypothetical protein